MFNSIKTVLHHVINTCNRSSDGPSTKLINLDVSWMDNENWRAPMSFQDNKTDIKKNYYNINNIKRDAHKRRGI